MSLAKRAIDDKCRRPALILAPSAAQSRHSLLTMQVDIIIHSAASVNLNPHVQQALQQNYVATSGLLKMAGNMQRCSLFLHVSSAYANGNQAQGSTVYEQLYPLGFGDSRLHHGQLVKDLMAMAPEEAEAKASVLIKLWGFPGMFRHACDRPAVVVRTETSVELYAMRTIL